MTADDLHRLALYRQKRGPLSAVLRNDAMLAQIAQLICVAGHIKNKHGGDMKPTDFAPFLSQEPENPEDLPVPTIEDLKAAFGVK